MRPCAFSTRFQAPPFGAKSLTVFETIPLSQRNRSSPRTATRRIQPRSCTAAPDVSAAISVAGASNSRGVCTHRYSDKPAVWLSPLPSVRGKRRHRRRCRNGRFSHRGAVPRSGHYFSLAKLRHNRVRPHPDYSLGIGCCSPALRNRRHKENG